ncbi:MAG TPA: 4Fe-4S binding protein, partial [Saprospiraceae bacterium]|nr:4Fe-4S binding protein [Saprospiraceae bacterium]
MNTTNESYRDKLATVDEKGKRVWLFPKMPKGKFYEYRKYVSYILLVILFGLPFLKYQGEPLVLFNILEGRFIIFGVPITHQDFYILVIATIIAIVFIVLFTVIYGRLFCGWVCPQTIFMEMVFRRIEYAIEGDANAQRRLMKEPWNSSKIFKKILKHTIFVFISILIAHTFLSYIIGVDEVWALLSHSPSEKMSGFIAMIGFTGAFYGVFAFLREQVCTTICPYGRLQGVMVDEKSLAVTYDFVRGEPRGKLIKPRQGKKSDCQDGCSTCKDGGSMCPADALKFELDQVSNKKGDCIDCDLCVHVCPTGIDIRDGIQLECVNCTACMDACDEVMVKINKPTGLIRIDSYEHIKDNKKSIWNARVMAYSAVLIILIGLESFLIAGRTSIEILVLRTPGQTYIDSGDGYITNLYNYTLINKTREEIPATFVFESDFEIIYTFVGSDPILKPNQKMEGSLFLKIDKSQ